MGKGTKKDPIILDNTGPSNNHAPGYWDSNEQTQGFEKVCAGPRQAGMEEVARAGCCSPCCAPLHHHERWPCSPLPPHTFMPGPQP
jgi:hypothetical protein